MTLNSIYMTRGSINNFGSGGEERRPGRRHYRMQRMRYRMHER